MLKASPNTFVIIGADTRSLIHFRKDLIKKILEKNYKVHVIGPEKDARGDISILTSLGAEVHYTSFSRTGLNPLKDFSTFLEIKKILRTIDPDIVLSFMIKPVIYGSLASWTLNVKNIYSLIPGVGFAFMSNSFKGKLVRFIVSFLYRFSLSKNKKVFFQNNDDLDLFVESNIVKREKCVKVNGSGVDMEEYLRTNDKDIRPTFLLAGRVLRDKGVCEFIEASNNLRKKYGEVFVSKLAGGFDKNPTSLSKKDISEMNIHGAVEILGDQNEMKGIYESANIYVLPSYREGTPRSTLEAMSMEMPIITTDAPGCRETVINGQNGYMVPVRSIDELERAMEKFISDPSLIESMGKESLKLVKEKFEINIVNQMYLKEMEIS